MFSFNEFRLSSRVKFSERDGSLNGTLWPQTWILKGVNDFFDFASFFCRCICICISMEVSPLNQNLKAQIFPFNRIFTAVSVSLFHEIRNGAQEKSFKSYCDLKNWGFKKVLSFFLVFRRNHASLIWLTSVQ